MAYTEPTDRQIDAAVNRMMHELGYYAIPLDDLTRRNELAQRIADSLPGRVVRAAQWFPAGSIYGGQA